jgi:hypothetical protein
MKTSFMRLRALSVLALSVLLAFSSCYTRKCTGKKGIKTQMGIM